MEAVQAGDLERVAALTHAHIRHGYQALVAQIDPATASADTHVDPYDLDVDID